MNVFDEIKAALDQAESLNRACNENARRMARMLVGRMRNAGQMNCEALKRELRDYNIHTGKWSDK